MADIFFVKGSVYDFAKALESLGQDLELSPKKLSYAAARSINRSLVTVQKHIDQGIRTKYYVKSGDVKKSLKMTKARAGKDLYGALDYEAEKSLPLHKFNAKKGKKFVSVRVLRANRQRRITPGGEKNIIKTKKGRAAVWIARDRKGDLQIFARTGNAENKENQQVQVLYGPSFMSFFTQPNINQELHEMRRESMRKNFVSEVNAVIKGYSLK